MGRLKWIASNLRELFQTRFFALAAARIAINYFQFNSSCIRLFTESWGSQFSYVSGYLFRFEQ